MADFCTTVHTQQRTLSNQLNLSTMNRTLQMWPERLRCYDSSQTHAHVLFSELLQLEPGPQREQVVVSSLCHDKVAPISAVGHLLLQARQPGTRCQTISVIRRLAKTLLGDY